MFFSRELASLLLETSQGGPTKNKKLILTAVVLSGNIVSSQPLYAQAGGSRPIENYTSEKQYESKGGSRISNADMRKVQQALKSKGFDPGPINGEFDAKTQAALRAYQKQNDLNVTGSVDEPTADSLGVVIVFIPEQ